MIAGEPSDLRTVLEAISGLDRLRDDPLAAMVLALAVTGDARDSRTAARMLDVAHALVLRAVAMLAADPALLLVSKRDSRTQRHFYEPPADIGEKLTSTPNHQPFQR